MNYYKVNSLINDGWTIKSTKISNTFSFVDMKKHYGENIVPLFLIDKDEKLFISTIENPLKPVPGDLIIALIKENNQEKNK